MRAVRLYFICPCCQRKLPGITFMRVATLVVKRTCSYCRVRVQLVVTPTPITGGIIHRAAITILDSQGAPCQSNTL